MEDQMKHHFTFNAYQRIILWGTMAVCIFVFAASALAASGHDDKSMSDHGDMAMDPKGMAGAFKHDMTMDGVRAEFQIMSLESMNMKDPGGATHHVMVKFYSADSGEQLKQAVGKIKIVNPSQKETVADLKDYSGIYAANFTFDQPGKYGVICLAKIEGKKPLYKFWYTH
jgi:hypothetical protein